MFHEAVSEQLIAMAMAAVVCGSSMLPINAPPTEFNSTAPRSI